MSGLEIRRRRVRLVFIVMVGLLLCGCDGEGLVPGSAEAISRVEIDPATGDFLALHQRLDLEDESKIDVATGAPPAPGRRASFTVHRSPDGHRWQRTSLVHSELEWTRESRGCIGDTCFEINDASLERTPGGETAVDLGDVPDCFAGEAGSESCLESQSISRPLDLVVRDGSGSRIAVALGTHGVAVWDGAEWSVTSVNTPAPKRWIWQNLGRVATVGAIVAAALVLLLFLVVHRTRYRPDG